MTTLTHMRSTGKEDELKVLIQKKGTNYIDIMCILVFVHLHCLGIASKERGKRKLKNK